MSLSEISGFINHQNNCYNLAPWGWWKSSFCVLPASFHHFNLLFEARRLELLVKVVMASPSVYHQAAFWRVLGVMFTISLLRINHKNVLKVDWIRSNQANDELLQANRFLCELDFRLQLSAERKKTSQYFMSSCSGTNSFSSHANCLQVVQYPCKDKKGK